MRVALLIVAALLAAVLAQGSLLFQEPVCAPCQKGLSCKNEKYTFQASFVSATGDCCCIAYRQDEEIKQQQPEEAETLAAANKPYCNEVVNGEHTVKLTITDLQQIKQGSQTRENIFKLKCSAFCEPKEGKTVTPFVYINNKNNDIATCHGCCYVNKTITPSTGGASVLQSGTNCKVLFVNLSSSSDISYFKRLTGTELQKNMDLRCRQMKTGLPSSYQYTSSRLDWTTAPPQIQCEFCSQGDAVATVLSADDDSTCKDVFMVKLSAYQVKLYLMKYGSDLELLRQNIKERCVKMAQTNDPFSEIRVDFDLKSTNAFERCQVCQKSDNDYAQVQAYTFNTSICAAFHNKPVTIDLSKDEQQAVMSGNVDKIKRRCQERIKCIAQPPYKYVEAFFTPSPSLSTATCNCCYHN